MTSERRHDTRASMVIPVEVHDEHGFSLYSTRDLSKGGLFFDAAIPHRVGSRVKLSFSLPGEGHPIQCQGEVVNVPDTRGYGMGIRFLTINSDDAERIERFAQSIVERV